MNSIWYDYYDEQGLVDLEGRLLGDFFEALGATPAPGGTTMGWRAPHGDNPFLPVGQPVPCLRPVVQSFKTGDQLFDSLNSSVGPDLPDLPGPTMLLLYWQAWEASSKLSVVFPGRPGKTWMTTQETLHVLSETRAEINRWMPWPDMADLLWGAGNPPYPGSTRGKTLAALQEVQRLMGRSHAGAHLRTPWL